MSEVPLYPPLGGERRFKSRQVDEKTWRVAFLSAKELTRSLPLTQLRGLGYRGRRVWV